MKYLNINELYNSSREYKDIIRAISGFLAAHLKGNDFIDMKPIIYADASTYNNEFAVAVSALAMNYSDKRANNLLKHYISEEYSNLDKLEVTQFFYNVLYSPNFEKSLIDSISKVRDSYFQDVEALHMYPGSPVFIPNNMFPHVENILNGTVKSQEV